MMRGAVITLCLQIVLNYQANVFWLGKKQIYHKQKHVKMLATQF